MLMHVLGNLTHFFSEKGTDYLYFGLLWPLKSQTSHVLRVLLPTSRTCGSVWLNRVDSPPPRDERVG